MSQSGSVVVAVNKSMSNADGGVWRSTDGGTTWADVTPVVSASKVLGMWRSVATSSNGQRIVAAKDSRGVFVSNDGGVTWVEKVPVTAGVFTDAAVSGDGSRMLVAQDTGASGEDGVWVSTDFGSTWSRTLAMTAITGGDISRDGSTMTAVRYPRTDPTSAVYVSRDGGANWVAEPAPQASWTGLALNESGERMILMAEYGRAQFATSTTTTTTTTTSTTTTTVAPTTTEASTTTAVTTSSTTTTSSSTTTTAVPSTTVAATTTSTIVDSPPPAVTPSMVETFKPKPLVKDEQVAEGETMTVRISGFQPFELVTIGFDDSGAVTSQAVGDPVRAFAGRKVLVTVRADATGTISVQAKLPTTVSGAVTLWAYGRESKVGFRQKFTVAELPRTGSEGPGANVMLAGSFVASGVVLFSLRRRLRRTNSAHITR
ncbi:MAG: WD40/YVTN/BNR-like repeat-containing protein [Actinomycetota bacterium]